MSKQIKRLVVKIGSSVIAAHKISPEKSDLCALVEQMCRLHEAKIEVVLVSSGAIVSGMSELNQKTRPSDLASLQAYAAVGQTVLMQTYSNLFGKYAIKCAQVLLTQDDFNDRTRHNNARNTLEAILSKKIIPIVNENDTVSTEEIKVGDNDKLSAFVASLIHADRLIILTDVDGFYSIKDGEKILHKKIEEVTEEIKSFATDTTNKNVSKGGMISKLEAVKIAANASIPSVIASSGTEGVLENIFKGELVGTYFSEKEEKLIPKKHWIAFIAKPKGKIVVDNGAKDALLKGGRSLLLPGVVKCEGHFKSEDVVVVADQDGQEIARGLTNYSIADLQKTGDKKGKQEVIHCDNLVLCKR